jgi:hypothetical protein
MLLSLTTIISAHSKCLLNTPVRKVTNYILKQNRRGCNPYFSNIKDRIEQAGILLEGMPIGGDMVRGLEEAGRGIRL